MTKILASIFALVLGVVTISPFSANAFLDPDSPKDGVYCEINEVKLFALSEEDCTKAGGAVTHTVTTTVEPANPNQEPEIQRTKDKEPEAP